MSSPEELLRSIERTREELALTVDTIAARLDPKLAAKRGVGKVKSGVNGVVDGAREKFWHTAEVTASSTSASNGSHPDGVGPSDLPPMLASKIGSAAHTVKSTVAPAIDAVTDTLSAERRNIAKPAVGAGLAALLALVAFVMYRRRSWHDWQDWQE